MYEVFTIAETIKWYFQESYSIITYSTSVGNWYDLYDDVQAVLRQKGIKDLEASIMSTIIGAGGIRFAASAIVTMFSKLTVIAGTIGIPVSILCLMGSDAAAELEQNLRTKNENEIYTFNWLVTYTTQALGKQKSTIILEYYCSLAYIMGIFL